MRRSAVRVGAARGPTSYFADASRSTSRSYLDDPRHVEVQVLADAHGNVVHLRRARLHDPAPPPEAGRGDARRRPCAPELRDAHGRDRRRRGARGRLSSTPGRSSACSTPDGSYYFMEMNTRIQVEHPVTELVTGVDLVRQQIRVAAGEPLGVHAGGRRDSAATRSSAGSTPRIRRTGSCRRRGRSRSTASRRGRACGSTRASSRARGLAVLRPDDRQADRPRRRPRGRDRRGCCARSGSTGSAA